MRKYLSSLFMAYHKREIIENIGLFVEICFGRSTLAVEVISCKKHL